MITFEITADVNDERRIVLTLPPEVPTGPMRLLVTVESAAPESNLPRTSLAVWAETHTETAMALNSPVIRCMAV